MVLDYTYIIQIHNKELVIVVNGVVVIVEKHDPLSMGVKPFFDLLVEQQSQLESFSDKRVSHPLTPFILQDRKRIVELSKAIGIQARAVEKGKATTMSEASFLILPLIKKHLLKIDKINSIETEKLVQSFLTALADSEMLSQAATTIGIGDYIAELKVVKSRLDSNFETRRAENSKRRIIKEKNLKVNILSALTNLLKAIDLAQVHNTAVNYTPVIAELNELFVTYTALVRSRSTRSKNAGIKKTAASSSTTTATA